MKQHRILVTGGAGFIGSHLVERLVMSDDTEVVVVIDKLSMGSRSNLAHLHSPKLTIIDGNVADYEQMALILNRYEIEVVCHLAVSPLVFSLKEPKLVIDNIIQMQTTLLECQRAGF